MRIVMANKFLYPRGGAETYAITLGRALADAGNDVQFFGMRDGRNTVGNDWGIATDPVDFHRMSPEVVTYPSRIVWSRDAYDKMTDLISRFSPDVIHLNNFNYQLTPSVIDAAHDAGVAVVLTAHDSQLLCPNHYLYIPSTGETCMRCVDGDPIECARHRCIHGSLAKSVIGAVEGRRYRRRGTYGHIDAIVCPSRFMKGVLDHDARFAARTEYLMNFSPEYERRDVDKGDYVLYAGRLSPEKGIANIVYAARRLPDVRFVVAGGGDDEWVRRVEGQPNIDYRGFLAGDELEETIRRARLALCVSVCYENCPMSVIEAQKLGTAVLTSGLGGIGELGMPERSLPDTRPETLAEAIEGLIGDDDAIAEMEEYGLERSAAYPTIAEYVDAITGIYERAAHVG